MNNRKIYPGIDHEECGGITPIANIIRDAWVFGLIPETETCAGWSYDRLELLYDQVSAAWKPYGQIASRLPPDLRDKHQRIYDEAMRRAKDKGWSPSLDDEA